MEERGTVRQAQSSQPPQPTPPPLMAFVKIQQKYLPLFIVFFIVLGTVVGHYESDWVKEYSSNFKNIILVLAFIILYPMLTNITIEKVVKGFKTPPQVIVGLVFNLIIAPVIMASIVYLAFTEIDEIAVGLILFGAMPCGGTVIAFTGYAKGNVELALIIVTINFLAAIVLAPIWILLFVGAYVEIPIEIITETIAAIIILPLIAGFITRKLIIKKYSQKRFMELKPVFPAISMSALYVLMFIVFLLQGTAILKIPEAVPTIIGVALLFYFLMFLVCILLCIVLRFNYEDSAALSFATSTGAPAVAIAIAVATFNPMAALPIAIGGTLLQTPSMVVFLKLLAKCKRFF